MQDFVGAVQSHGFRVVIQAGVEQHGNPHLGGHLENPLISNVGPILHSGTAEAAFVFQHGPGPENVPEGREIVTGL